MWVFRKNNAEEFYYLLPDKTVHIVGRTQADFVLLGDTSISRSHANLYPSKDCVKIVDTSSKYGTYYNENIESNVPLERNVPTEIKKGDQVRFGRLGNLWTLDCIDICTLVSTLSAVQKKVLQQLLDLFKGKVVDVYMKECTHLTMNEITVTLKVLQALVDNMPIVSVEFWEAFGISLKAGKSTPNPDDYIPKLAENFLNKEKISFASNPSRKVVFAGKTFVFLSKKHLERYEAIITHAGGICKHINQGLRKARLLEKDVVVIQYVPSTTSSQCTQPVEGISDYIKQNKLRIIPDVEIGLAILHCCTTKYCNPEYDLISEFIPYTNVTPIVPTNEILAKGTQLDDLPSTSDEIMQIPASSMYDPTQTSITDDGTDVISQAVVSDKKIESFKRKQPDDRLDDEESESFKKLHMDVDFTEIEIPDSAAIPDASKQNNIKVEDEVPGTSERNDSVSLDNTKLRSIYDKFAQFGKPKESENVTGKFANKRQRNYNLSDDDLNFAGTSKKPKKDAANVKKRHLEEDESLHITPSSSDEQTDNEDQPLVAWDFNQPSRGSSAIQATSTRQHRTRGGSSKSDNTVLDSAKNPKRQKVTEPQKDSKTNKNSTKKDAAKRNELKTTNWLSTSLMKCQIKSEESKDKYDEDTNKWIDSIKLGFQVRVKKMNITVRSFRDNAPENGTSTAQLCNSTDKNFKAFVKKTNYKPQSEVLKTVPFSVTNNNNVFF